jgi:hypothetical protein
MIVGRIDWAANGTDDVLTLYNIIDPEGALPTALTTITADFDQSAFNIVSTAQGQTEVFDEIRFGESFEDVVPVPRTTPTVDAGVDMVTWSGEPVPMSATVVNNHPTADLTYAWSADPADGVDFSATDIEDPIVTITKITENPSVVTLTLTANNVGEAPDQAREDSLTIDVYDDACKATIGLDPSAIDPSDFDGNCVTGIEDLREIAIAWLHNYSLTEPVSK